MVDWLNGGLVKWLNCQVVETIDHLTNQLLDHSTNFKWCAFSYPEVCSLSFLVFKYFM